LSAEKTEPVSRKFSSLLEFLRPVDTALLRVPKWAPLAAFFGISLLILLLGHAGWNWHASALEASVKKEVAASVDAKIARISDWLAERRGDAAVLVKDEVFLRDVAASLANGRPGGEADQRIAQRLRAVRDAYRYKEILVLDADGVTRSRSSPDAPSPGVYGRKRIGEAISSGETLLADLHYDTRGGGKIFYYAVVAPIPGPGAGTTPLGAVLLRMDPADTLFPILDAPLGPWDSAETLLAREENGVIVYLKELRQLGAPPVTVRRSVNEPTLLAALAARGHEGVLAGTDYRGVEVVGAARRVPGTPWIVVGKVDSEELYSTLLREARIAGLVLALFVLGAAVAATLWWRAIAARGSATYYRLRVEREALRKHYVNQVEYANDSILLLDHAGRILDVNEHALEVYGYGRAELLGADVGMLRSLTARDRIGVLLDEWSEGGRIYETWHRRKDGGVMPVEVSGRAFRVEGQAFYQKVVRDITERKKIEQELRGLNEALEQRVAERTMELEGANRELKAFSYTVAHDLQVPLRHVRGFLGIALEDHGAAIQGDARGCVERAMRAAHNMSDMIRALLDFSRVTRAEMRLERMALDDLVSEVVAEFAPECAGRTIEWKIGSLPAVIADRHLLRMVLSNLISNALKFTRNRSVAVIEIGPQSGPRDGQGESVVFFVRDNGAGFDMAAASRLFEPFQRLHFAKDFEGTGIGLATCRRLIERHGGRMWAESVVDAGAAFYVVLPEGASGPEHPAAMRAA
jgi:PAS domain S-box-containing protein